MKSNNHRLQFITHHNARYNYVESARIALEGGCRWVQLRMKGAESTALEAAAHEVKALCRSYGAIFIIDDDVRMAQHIGADGVHLGKDDMPVAEARKVLGPGFIIGATVNSFDDIERHLHDCQPDYFGCGPFRFTTTKERLAPVLGLEGYREIIQRMRNRGIDTPLVAIGGITKEDIPHLVERGIGGIALSGSILNADDPIGEMREVAEMLEKLCK